MTLWHRVLKERQHKAGAAAPVEAAASANNGAAAGQASIDFGGDGSRVGSAGLDADQGSGGSSAAGTAAGGGVGGGASPGGQANSAPAGHSPGAAKCMAHTTQELFPFETVYSLSCFQSEIHLPASCTCSAHHAAKRGRCCCDPQLAGCRCKLLTPDMCWG